MNYIGSKYSLLAFLQNNIKAFTGYNDDDEFVFADLFAGTGVVGQAYREKGCYVISNDIQHYSYCLNKHFIENSASVDDSLLEHFNSLKPVEGFVYNNFCYGSGCGRNFFTDENGMLCDAVRQEIERLKNKKKIDEGTYYFYLASLINSIDKYANTASIYGAFLKHIKKTAQKKFKLELLPVIEGKKGEVYNEDAEALIKRIKGDVLYLDPPYNSRQYCSNYHVLETISRYDDPVLSVIAGLRDNSLQKSRFCSKKSVDTALEDVIKNADFKYIFLSYNNEGLMSPETIKNMFIKHGKYHCFTKEHKRFKADKEGKRNVLANSTTEYLHCLEKN